MRKLRNLHAKIYILQGREKAYTIVGSGNFTNTAWGKYTSRNNRANIEAAWLYVEKRHAGLLRPVNIDVDTCRFVPREDQDRTSVGNYSRNVPEVDFVLNWETKTLAVRIRAWQTGCIFYNIRKDMPLEMGNRTYDLLPQEISLLAKNTIIQIKQSSSNGDRIYTYYVQQEKFTSRPLDFPVNMSVILKYWSMLGDVYSQELKSRELAESATDESGIIDEGKVKQFTFLNEMAAHFNALIKLEKHIFNQPRGELSRTMHYYLLSDNIDTVPFYLRDLQRQSENGEILKSFHWMILQILRTDFYSRALRIVKTVHAVDKEGLQNELKGRRKELKAITDALANGVAMSSEQREWIIRQLATDE